MKTTPQNSTTNRCLSCNGLPCQVGNLTNGYCSQCSGWRMVRRYVTAAKQTLHRWLRDD